MTIYKSKRFMDNRQRQREIRRKTLYLKKIVALCKTNKIKLVLINPPITRDYFKKIPPKFISNYYTTIAELKGNVEFWDFHSLALEKKCYGDADHINSYGAKILTQKII